MSTLKTLVVGPGLMGARALAKNYENGYAAAPMDALAGHRFGAIHVHKVARTGRVQEWLEQVARLRLAPGCQDNIFYYDSPLIGGIDRSPVTWWRNHAPSKE